MFMPMMRPEVRRGAWRARDVVPAGHDFQTSDAPMPRPLSPRGQRIVGLLTLAYMTLIVAKLATKDDSGIAIYFLALFMALATYGIAVGLWRFIRAIGRAAGLGRPAMPQSD